MKVRVTWPDGTITEEYMYQKSRPIGEMERREDYYIMKEIYGAKAEICVDRYCFKIERIDY